MDVGVPEAGQEVGAVQVGGLGVVQGRAAGAEPRDSPALDAKPRVGQHTTGGKVHQAKVVEGGDSFHLPMISPSPAASNPAAPSDPLGRRQVMNIVATRGGAPSCFS